MVPSANVRMLALRVCSIGIVVLSLAVVVHAQEDSRVGDRFNYRETTTIDSNSGTTDYGPRNWNRVRCNDIDDCPGWPNKWEFARGWSLKGQGNQCRRCDVNAGNCGEHQQGPVDLWRRTGLNPNITANNRYRECEDVHWMKYDGGSCNWEDMTDNRVSEYRNNFHIRAHALQLLQPTKDARLKCPNGLGGSFPKLDFSWGFPEWWQQSFMEIKTPSEFTQDGMRYDGQINYQMFYQLPYADQGVTGPRKRVGIVSIFLHAYSNVLPDPLLDKMICQFRKTEDQVRQQCGLESVANTYRGCSNFRRRARKLRGNETFSNKNYFPGENRTNKELEPPIHPVDYITDPEEDQKEPITDADFNKYIEEQIAMGGGNGNWTGHPDVDPERHLLNYDHVEFSNWGFLVNVRTEYYHRLQTSLTVPPCLENTHNRVMKDPLRITTDQLAEIQRLLADRISPVGTYKSCRNYSAGQKTTGVNGGPAVKVARPIQQFHPAVRMTFCECKDWKSKWNEDKAWCKLSDNEADNITRYFRQPYNFHNDGGRLPSGL